MATSTIKPSGGDYTTLTAWEAAKQGTLTEIEVAECYSFGSSGLDDNLTIDGSITTSSAYMMVTVAAGERHSGVWDAAKFHLSPSTTGRPITLLDDYAVAEWLQIAANTAAIAIAVQLSNIGNILRYCLIDGQGSTNNQGIYAPTGSEQYIYSNVIWGSKAGFFGGIRISHANSCYIYNNTLYDNYYGVRSNGETQVVKNNACFNNTTNFTGTADTTNSGYNATNSASGAPGSNNIYSLTAANEFVSLTDGAEDFHLLSTSNLIGVGADLSGVFTDDIDGDTRSSWDIGADEYVASGGQSASLSDSLAISGSYVPVAHYSLGLTDSIGLGEGKTSAGHYLADLAGLLTIDDTFSGLAKLIASISDSVALTGQESASSLAHAALTDTIDLSDSAQAVAFLFAALSESITLSDAVSGLLAAKAALSDILTIDDNRSAIGNLIAGLIDNLAFVDIVAGVTESPGQSAAISDVILLSDSRTASGHYLIGINDSLSINDAQTAIAGYLQTIVDILQLSDVVSVQTSGVTGPLTVSVSVLKATTTYTVLRSSVIADVL